MTDERIEYEWISAFAQVFGHCAMRKGEMIVILAESGSRAVNVHLAELALGQMGLSYFRLTVPSPPDPAGPIVRSSGASRALGGQDAAVRTLAQADVVIDLTREGLMHAPQTAAILEGGARIMNISNEHPAALARLVPDEDLKARVKDAAARCRAAKAMTVTSPHGTDLTVAMDGASTVGVWGWTDRPGTLAHWPGGLVASFPAPGTVGGRLAFRPGDINLTFKRYFESAVDLVIEADHVTSVKGTGADAALMRDYFAGFDDPAAYATSHVGWGLNPLARYEALTIYDRSDTNGTELRTLAGTFLYSTGANEFAGRFTAGHFDLPMMGCDIALDGVLVVERGKLV